MNEQVNKLVYLYWNLQIRDKIGDQRSYWFDENEEENESEKKNQAEDEYTPDIFASAGEIDI